MFYFSIIKFSAYFLKLTSFFMTGEKIKTEIILRTFSDFFAGR
jgi:hypothetical protein